MEIRIHEMSFSGLSEYLLCPLKFKFNRIEGYMPEFIPVNLAYGSGVHCALEAYYKALMNAKPALSIPVMQNIVRNSLENDAIRFGNESKQDLVDKAGALFEEAVAHPYDKLLGVEVPFEIPVDTSFTIIGRIDLLTEELKRTVITDFKTMCRKPGDNDIIPRMQLITYGHAYPDAELRIRALVKKKQPECIDRKVLPKDYQRQRIPKLFADVKRCIEAGHFYPHPGWQCDGCQFRTHCKNTY